MIATFRREGHWLLNDADAKAYGLALRNALRHVPVTIAQKYFDFGALAVAVATYEFPRVALSAELRAAATQRSGPARGPAQVFQFAQPPVTAREPGPTPTFTPPDVGPGFVQDGADGPIGGPAA